MGLGNFRETRTSRLNPHITNACNSLIESLERRALMVVAPTAPTLAAINPVADAYVQDGATADTNYGSATSLFMKTYGIGSNRRAFFRFDLSGLPSTFANVMLNLNTNLGSTSDGAVPVEVYGLADSTWTESSLTWNNQPTFGAEPLATNTLSIAGANWYTWDLTAYARSLKAAGQNVMSLAVISPKSTQTVMGIASRESSAKPSLSFSLSGPSVRPISTNRIDIGWLDQSTNETGFIIQRSTDGTNFSEIARTGANVPAYSDTTASEGATYSYRVMSFQGTDVSTVLGPTAGQTLPLSPATLSLGSVAGGAAALYWQDRSAGEAGYVVERSIDNVTFVPIGSLGANATSFLDGQAPEGTSYYRVRAFDAGGWSTYSNVLPVSSNSPNAPSNLNATFPTSTSITVKWTDRSSTETGFTLQRSVDQATWTTVAASLPAGTTSYLDTGLLPYGRYYYRVRANGPGGAGAYSAPAAIERLASARQSLLSNIYVLDYTLATGASYETRALSQRANYVLTLGEDARSIDKAERYLDSMWLVQDMDTASSRYGRVPWSGTSWTDGNAIEFAMNNFAAAYLGHLGRLDPGYLDRVVGGYTVRQHIQAAIVGVKNHSVSVNYTNIYLMRAANLVLLGEMVNDGTAVALGYAALGTWLDDTKASGINEFDSPGYAAVNITTLQRLFTNSRSPAVRSRTAAALDVVYEDAAANFFAPRSELAGAHSRDYDFLGGVDSMNAWYFMQGLSASPGIASDLYAASVEGTYQPAASTLALAAMPTRIVKQKWSTTAGTDKYTYITPDFSIGSTSAFYSNHDKQITASLASSKAMPQLSVVEDGWDSPWGTYQPLDAAGKPKPYHMQNSIAAVQDRGTVLAISNLGPEFTAVPSATYTSVGTNLIFPANADKIYVDGIEITDRSATIPLSLNSVVGVREGNSVVAFRIFLADGLGGQAASFALKFDGPAGENAARVVAYHYNGAVRTFTGDCRVGYALSVRSCTTDAQASAFLAELKNASIPVTVSGNKTRASITIGGTVLTTELDRSTELPTLRQVNGANYLADRFTVSDGVTTQDLAATLLDSLNLSPMFVEGRVSNDLTGLPLTGRSVFLDVNQNGQLDEATTSRWASNAATAIVDATSTAATKSSSTIAVSGLAAVTKVRVAVNIQHSKVSDLTLTLVSPIGTRIQLANRAGGSGVNIGTFGSTTGGAYVPAVYAMFDDSAASTFASAAAPYNANADLGFASFSPAQALAALNGQSPNGTWTLEVSDSATGNVGWINRWQLLFNTDAEPTATTDANGFYSFTGFSTGTSGTQTFRLAAAANEVVTSPSSYALNLGTTSGFAYRDFGVHAVAGNSLIVAPQAITSPLNRAVQISAELRDAAGNLLSAPMSFATNLGTIDTQGKLFSPTPGVATVTVTSGGVSTTTRVKFTALPAAAASFNMESAGTLIDSSGNGLNGTISATGVTAVSGYRGQGLSFDGLTGSVNLGQPALLHYTGKVTLSAWIKPIFSATSGLQYVLGRAYSSSAPSAETALRLNNNTYQVGSWDGVSQYVSATIPQGDYNTWVHLIGTYDGTGWRLYRNGTLVASNTTTLGLMTGFNRNWRIGSAEAGGTPNRFFKGIIDDVRIDNTGLSDSDAFDLYRSTLAPIIVTPATAANAGNVAGSTTLSVLAEDIATNPSGEASLAYTWSVMGTPPGTVTFSDNNTHAARGATATFSNLGTYVLRVHATNPSGFSAESTVTVTVTSMPALTNPPTITSTTFEFDTPATPMSVQIGFSTDVSASLTASDIVLTNLTSNTVIPTGDITISGYNTSSNVATITFPSYANGVLPNGNYRLTLSAGSVNDALNNASTTATTFDFFALSGDANRDRVVDFNDFLGLQNNFGNSVGKFSQGDFNFDGKIDFNDFLILQNNFNVTV